jgi:hypothetical protein
MPPRGVKPGSKRARQYEHVKVSEREQGRSEERAEEIAALTVNKARARAGESRQRSRPRFRTSPVLGLDQAGGSSSPLARRIFSMAERSSRETCICEVPTRWAISDWVRSWANRR